MSAFEERREARREDQLPKVELDDQNYVHSVSYVLESVQPQTWNNIPYCLVKAIQSILEACTMLDVNQKKETHDHQDRIKNILMRMSIVDKKLLQQGQDLQFSTESSYKQVQERVVQNNIEANFKLQSFGKSLDRIVANSNESKEFIDMKINRIVYAEEEIAQLQRQITQFTLQQADVVSKLEKSCLSQFTYLNELILAPGLLGNGKTFQTLQDCLYYLYNNAKTSASKIQEQLVAIMTEEINQAREDLSQKLAKTKKDFFTNIEHQVNTMEKRIANASQSNLEELQTLNTVLSDRLAEQNNKTQYLQEQLALLAEREKSRRNVEMDTFIQLDNQVQELNRFRVRVVDNVKEMETNYKEKIKKVKEETRVNQIQVNKDLREIKSKLEKLQANKASHSKVKDSNNAQKISNETSASLPFSEDTKKTIEKLIDYKLQQFRTTINIVQGKPQVQARAPHSINYTNVTQETNNVQLVPMASSDRKSNQAPINSKMREFQEFKRNVSNNESQSKEKDLNPSEQQYLAQRANASRQQSPFIKMPLSIDQEAPTNGGLSIPSIHNKSKGFSPTNTTDPKQQSMLALQNTQQTQTFNTRHQQTQALSNAQTETCNNSALNKYNDEATEENLNPQSPHMIPQLIKATVRTNQPDKNRSRSTLRDRPDYNKNGNLFNFEQAAQSGAFRVPPIISHNRQQTIQSFMNTELGFFKHQEKSLSSRNNNMASTETSQNKTAPLSVKFQTIKTKNIQL